MKTWQTKVNGRVIQIKALKQEAEFIGDRFARLVKLNQYCRELYGVIGEKESESILFSPFSVAGEVSPEGQSNINTFIDSLPETLTSESAKRYLAEAKELFNKYIPVVDKRKTKEEKVKQAMDYELIQAQRKAENDEWIAQWCLNDTPVPIPQGMMAVYLELEFDDSDIMTDYFNSHHQIGVDMLLAIVPKQAEKQAVARRILSQYPNLNKYNWEWHTENYSMGHGNYLLSEYTGHVVKHKGYDGRDEVNTRFAIRMTTYNKEMLAYKEYPGNQSTPETVPSITPEIRRNEKLNGIEIVFPSKPDVSVIEQLKGLGFRWSKFQGLWYNRYSEPLFNQVCNIFQEAGV